MLLLCLRLHYSIKWGWDLTSTLFISVCSLLTYKPEEVPVKIVCFTFLSWISHRLFFPLWLWPWKMNQSINTQTGRTNDILSLRINLRQIRYNNGSFLHINRCIYLDYFGILLSRWKAMLAPATSSAALFYQSYLSIKAFLFVFGHSALPIAPWLPAK